MPKDITTRNEISKKSEILLNLNHENVLKYHNFLQKKPNMFFISELEMCNLRHWVSGLVNSAMTMKIEISALRLIKGGRFLGDFDTYWCAGPILGRKWSKNVQI